MKKIVIYILFITVGLSSLAQTNAGFEGLACCLGRTSPTPPPRSPDSSPQGTQETRPQLKDNRSNTKHIYKIKRLSNYKYKRINNPKTRRH